MHIWIFKKCLIFSKICCFFFAIALVSQDFIIRNETIPSSYFFAVILLISHTRCGAELDRLTWPLKWKGDVFPFSSVSGVNPTLWGWPSALRMSWPLTKCMHAHWRELVNFGLCYGFCNMPGCHATKTGWLKEMVLERSHRKEGVMHNLQGGDWHLCRKCLNFTLEQMTYEPRRRVKQVVFCSLAD